MRRRLAVLIVLIGLAAGCANAPLTPPGRFAAQADLSGETITVGSKEFAEQILLCKMTILLLQSAGATAVDRCNTEGSANTRAGLLSGQVDMYWEYTGTAWRTQLNQTSTISDPAALYAAVRDADAGNQVTWLAPTPFNDTYAIGVRTDTARRLGVSTISDYAALVRSGSPEASLCVAQEFTGREDGLQGLLATYGMQIDDARLDTLDIDQIYTAIGRGSPCAFGEVFATDGRINPMQLTTLIHDRRYFLPYNAALAVRTDVVTRAPELAAIGTMLAPTLTEPVMRELNQRVSGDGDNPEDVARTFLRGQGLIG